MEICRTAAAMGIVMNRFSCGAGQHTKIKRPFGRSADRNLRIVEKHDPESGKYQIRARSGECVGLSVRLLQADVHQSSRLDKLARRIDKQARDINTQDETRTADALREFGGRLAAAAADIENALAGPALARTP
jgi:hypothetical protein